MDMMIDLETMSTKRNARVLQAGWACFHPASRGVLPDMSGEMNVNSDSCVDGHVSHSTFLFWITASEAARASVARKGVDIAIALANMFYMYEDRGCKAIWSNGATFDIVIVEHWADYYGLRVPWKFYDHRDTRTIWAEAKSQGWTRERGETAHTGRADAIAQVLQVQSAISWMRTLAVAPPPGPPDPPAPVPPRVA